MIIIIICIIISFIMLFQGYKDIAYLILLIPIAMIVYLYDTEKNNNDENAKPKNIDITYLIEDFVRETMLIQIYALAIIKEDGELIWHNKMFEDTFESINYNGELVSSIVRGLEVEEVIKSSSKISHKLKLNRRIYEVYSRNIKIRDFDDIYLVYFNDITNITEATKESIMLIEVDNLNEVVKMTEENNGPFLIAEVEKTINLYAQALNAMIRKYDNNKYVLSVPDYGIDSQISTKFDILDKVREINLGNKMEVTLSIGVGRGGSSPAQNHGYAITAKELALGRGGDQAVVKKGEKIFFFGGNKKELEKRTRVRARVVSHALKDLIYESSKVYIMGHKNPDMDCFGAAVGIAAVVRQLGKQCNIVLNNDTRAIDGFLDKIRLIKEYEGVFIDSEEAAENIDDDTLLIIVDVHSNGYVLDKNVFEKSKKIVIIDHHRRSPDFIEGALLTYIEVYASSTSELVTEMVQYMLDKPKLYQLESEALLAGIAMDTKNFVFKTGVRTFEAASFLRRVGADTVDIKRFFSNDLESHIQKAETIRSAEVVNNIAIAVCPPNVTQTVIAAQVADDLLNITGIQASFVFVKIDRDIHISGRSLGEVNVQIILESLGGGGHMTMAGAKLTDVAIEEAKKLLQKAISDNLREGE
ncbi:DHH family phosphoesterase [Clostridium manihotivorum]|uniref:Cyclic-di-AMP phosphodiesterase n=2 Tax=Clostridium manihotivorum TaxID=2320868 RepID=A0A410E1G1_9CLOT|nr:DHH family phosphoesterase [Clostridium manihotivorum]